MTEKRFKVWKTIGSFHCWHIEDVIDDKVVVDNIMHKYEADRLCDKLNELNDENEQLKKELQKYTEIHFRNENGTHTVLYEKKE